MRILWVTMGMHVPFVAPSLTLRRCPCATSVSCNNVRIALTHIHVTMPRCFNSATMSWCAHKLLILILYLVGLGALWGEPSLKVGCTACAMQGRPL